MPASTPVRWNVYGLDGTTTGEAFSVNADGTVAYAPAANYFGTDSFTYRLNDGPLESTLATVNVTVTAVNDAGEGHPSAPISVVVT